MVRKEARSYNTHAPSATIMYQNVVHIIRQGAFVHRVVNSYITIITLAV